MSGRTGAAAPPPKTRTTKGRAQEAVGGAATVHPTAEVEEGAVLGAGTRIWRFCHVQTGARIGAGCVLGQSCYVASGARIGDRCRIQNHVSLYDGVTLGDDVFVGPSAVFTNVRRPRAAHPQKPAYGETRVGSGATIGANATVVCGVRIGARAMVGAGAVVTRDVPDHAVAVGAPARITGWICACGASLAYRKRPPAGKKAGGTCPHCGIGPGRD
jgi:UDP-2-acetamido-3-amino-2,3-dideoxy-glucuronate N-acetyltransferase